MFDHSNGEDMKKNKIYLFGLLILAFIVRLIPSRNLTFPGYDPYLHHDIVMRIVNEGFGIISTDPVSLMGLYPYSYPPLYHIIGAALYKLFNIELIFFIIPTIFGVAAVYVFYKTAYELFLDEKAALLSALLFAFVPSFVTRTSVFIPETMGIFLFTCLLYIGVKYIKSIPNYENIDNFEGRKLIKIFKGNMTYILIGILLFGIYLLTHRGWVFFGISFIILIITFMMPTFRKKPLILLVLGALGAICILIIATSEFSYALARFQEVPVRVLGYPKWVGIVQLILGFYGIIIFIKSKNPIYKFLSLWAIIFLAIGSYSFRFRDPYSTIPLSFMAGYVLAYTVIPKLNELKSKFSVINPLYKKLIPIAIVLLLITPIVQGAFSAYSYVVQPTEGEMGAFNWINENTPKNTTILTLKEEGYFLIGNTHRKDLILWKTVYQGFMEKAPSVMDTYRVNKDVSTIFKTSQKNEAYFLLDKYNVTYIFISNNMYKTEVDDYGLGEYMPYDTHFKTAYVNDESAVYQYIKNPTLEPPNIGKMKLNNEYSKTIDFIEQFWNGYSYSEFSRNYTREYGLEFEDIGNYKGNYALNAQIIYLYDYLYKKTRDNKLKERNDYLLKWLKYKQMNDGAFPSGRPPAEYTSGTMEVLYPLIKMEYNNTEKDEIISKGTSFIDSQTGNDDINVSNILEPKKGLLGRDYITLKTDAQVCGMYPSGKREIIYNVIGEQKGDGSWESESYMNIAILKGLCLYYNETNDKRVKESIDRGVSWLKENQDESGKFKDDSENNPYGLKQYADAFYIYYTSGEKDHADKTLNYIKSKNINGEISPLTSYLALFFNLADVYGVEKAFDICNEFL